eukprot:TRINITY_DN10908_c0_g1_i1.p1 TRINITY_DN10908_c0_g1~~TRINITY_DN10908_c0_g1_i1.p1  ORF type:complete len:158 (+),score=39.00 TRINITY_DN10908_c0_g1_i1:101-574(+)
MRAKMPVYLILVIAAAWAAEAAAALQSDCPARSDIPWNPDLTEDLSWTSPLGPHKQQWCARDDQAAAWGSGCHKVARAPADLSECTVADKNYATVILRSGEYNCIFANVAAGVALCSCAEERIRHAIFCCPGGSCAPSQHPHDTKLAWGAVKLRGTP